MLVERSEIGRRTPRDDRDFFRSAAQIAKSAVPCTRLIPIDISPLYLSFIKLGSKTAAARAWRLIKFPSPGFSRPAAAKRMPECKIERAEEPHFFAIWRRRQMHTSVCLSLRRRIQKAQGGISLPIV
jgi:hypothetical protein